MNPVMDSTTPRVIDFSKVNLNNQYKIEKHTKPMSTDAITKPK
jgi:hypothetical protein